MLPSGRQDSALQLWCEGVACLSEPSHKPSSSSRSDNPRAREALRQCLPDLLRNPQVCPWWQKGAGCLCLPCQQPCHSCTFWPATLMCVLVPSPAPATVHGLPEGRCDDAALAGAAAGERGAPAGRGCTGHRCRGPHAARVSRLAALPAAAVQRRVHAFYLPPADYLHRLTFCSSCCGCLTLQLTTLCDALQCSSAVQGGEHGDESHHAASVRAMARKK